VVHQAAARHKTKIQDYLALLLRDAGLGAEHAPDLMLLFDGAVISAVREGSAAPALRAKRLAALLLSTDTSVLASSQFKQRSGMRR
jgi:hypothetical protein